MYNSTFHFSKIKSFRKQITKIWIIVLRKQTFFMFITLEGPEGAGKTTLLKSIEQALIKLKQQIYITREPGGFPFGEHIRKLLLEGNALDPKTELMLFLADRAEHMSKFILPALKGNMWVICDRFIDSTLVYQGIARGLPCSLIQELNKFVTKNIQPDITFILDLPVEMGLGRVQYRNRLDNESLDFHQKVRQGFLDLAKQEEKRIKILDATQSAQKVFQDAFSFLPLNLI